MFSHAEFYLIHSSTYGISTLCFCFRLVTFSYVYLCRYSHRVNKNCYCFISNFTYTIVLFAILLHSCLLFFSEIASDTCLHFVQYRIQIVIILLHNFFSHARVFICRIFLFMYIIYLTCVLFFYSEHYFYLSFFSLHCCISIS